MNPGNRYVKIIQQIAAAALAGKRVIYHFNNRDFDDELLPFIEWLQNSDMTISGLLRAYATTIKDLNDEGARIGDLNLFQEIMDFSD
jgi:arsenate reductase-like glutaredoxin family protein